MSFTLAEILLICSRQTPEGLRVMVEDREKPRCSLKCGPCLDAQIWNHCPPSIFRGTLLYYVPSVSSRIPSESTLWKVYQICGPLCDGVCSGLNSGPQIHLHLIPQTCKCGDFPGGPVVKNLPTNAGEVCSISGPGTKIPHAMGQLSLCCNYWAL